MSLDQRLAGRDLADISESELIALQTLEGLSDSDLRRVTAERLRRYPASPAWAQSIRPPIGAVLPGVRITGIDIPFGDIVMLMVKWSLAAIPAMIILSIVGAIVFGVLGALAKGVAR